MAGVDNDNFVPFPQVGLLSTTGGLSGQMIKPIAWNMVKNCAKKLVCQYRVSDALKTGMMQ